MQYFSHMSGGYAGTSTPRAVTSLAVGVLSWIDLVLPLSVDLTSNKTKNKKLLLSLMNAALIPVCSVLMLPSKLDGWEASAAHPIRWPLLSFSQNCHPTPITHSHPVHQTSQIWSETVATGTNLSAKTQSLLLWQTGKSYAWLCFLQKHFFFHFLLFSSLLKWGVFQSGSHNFPVSDKVFFSVWQKKSDQNPLSKRNPTRWFTRKKNSLILKFH